MTTTMVRILQHARGAEPANTEPEESHPLSVTDPQRRCHADPVSLCTQSYHCRCFIPVDHHLDWSTMSELEQGPIHGPITLTVTLPWDVAQSPHEHASQIADIVNDGVIEQGKLTSVSTSSGISTSHSADGVVNTSIQHESLKHGTPETIDRASPTNDLNVDDGYIDPGFTDPGAGRYRTAVPISHIATTTTATGIRRPKFRWYK